VVSQILDTPEGARRFKGRGGMVGDGRWRHPVAHAAWALSSRTAALLDGLPAQGAGRLVRVHQAAFDEMIAAWEGSSPATRRYPLQADPSSNIMVLFIDRGGSVARPTKRGRQVVAHKRGGRKMGVLAKRWEKERRRDFSEEDGTQPLRRIQGAKPTLRLVPSSRSSTTTSSSPGAHHRKAGPTSFRELEYQRLRWSWTRHLDRFGGVPLASESFTASPQDPRPRFGRTEVEKLRNLRAGDRVN